MSATIRCATMPIRFTVSVAIGLVALFVSAAVPDSGLVVVALPPLAGIVSEACGGTNNIWRAVSLIPAGGEPHSFEPSARDVSSVASAEYYLSVGFPFEERLLTRVRSLRPNLHIYSLTNGCSLRAGDPHVWLSISNRAQLVRNVASALGIKDVKPSWTPNDEACAAVRGKTVVSCHPSWNYLAADLGVTVIDLEHDGREPSARSVANALARAKKAGVRVVISEPQFSLRTAERFARALGARVVVIDPLAADSRSAVSNFIEAVRE